ncbi:plasma membrane Nramp family manganese ion transmembrane transporter [Schizosaccharomyces pombe]|uniref:Manganese transporter pdt1 n=1 Tax=Schizosaccharomyces pombe (strain 972 / ATCC 24843) TaxID=284812 RepID=PDT1_SCHPO|nr:Nramp family Mn(2+) transporter [Schizosaccharomyces pombe]Q10177.1 RecName: Full=Manganese transporter pdt1 [Schizosaccharomyces pombe 972h-]CAA93297.1 Nramp family manganese ion transporter [Schizosaccharomyces pombe]|eukprot:NP_594537.1 Nramp family Mn(2+) transporter [Schizosaccharomyces pombe]
MSSQSYYMNDLDDLRSLESSTLNKKDTAINELNPEQNDTRRSTDLLLEDKYGIQTGFSKYWKKCTYGIREYCKFIGPGFLIAVAYIDPGNYSTDLDAGSRFQYKLLFIVFLSNLFAVYLQSLCIRLGSVTGMDLARNCREHYNRYICWSFYVLAEIAIIATDIAEVIGTAVALKILMHIPLVAGVVITILDVLLVLIAWRPEGSMLSVRIFETAVALLVLVVAISFAVVLGRVHIGGAGTVFKGFLPSSTVFSREGLYSSIGILGATVMPHSLFLGSGLVQTRLRDLDVRRGNYTPVGDCSDYRPTHETIKHSLTYSIVEVALSLFTFALFTNSSILIVAGAVFYNTSGADTSDLFSIYDLLKEYVSISCGRLFAVALLFSGMSAGYVCTIAGQIVSEGYINWNLRPWLRRVITRAIAIIPCLVVSAAVGQSGLNQVLNASQVCLSILLPFLTFPLVMFTCSRKVMRVVSDSTNEETGQLIRETHDYSLGWTMTIVTWAIWLFLTALNLLLIVWLGMGVSF